MNVMTKRSICFTQMTDKQIAMFSRKLAELPELSHFATGEAGRSYEAFGSSDSE